MAIESTYLSASIKLLVHYWFFVKLQSIINFITALTQFIARLFKIDQTAASFAAREKSHFETCRVWGKRDLILSSFPTFSPTLFLYIRIRRRGRVKEARARLRPSKTSTLAANRYTTIVTGTRRHTSYTDSITPTKPDIFTI